MKPIQDRILHIVLVIAAIALAIMPFSAYGHDIEDGFAKIFLKIVDRLMPQPPPEEHRKLIGPVEALRVPIFIYHSVRPHAPEETSLLRHYIVGPDSFENQLNYLKENDYTVISMDRLASSLYAGEQLPPKAVVLTFDDGWENQYRYAFPLLQKYDFTGTFYIFTNAIGHKNFLTWEQVIAMDQAGMDIGGHTRSHPFLTKIISLDGLRAEIVNGKEDIERHLHKIVRNFAYPFGQYNDMVISIVREAGYKTARSTYIGTRHTLDDIHQLRAVEATDDMNKFVRDLNQ